MKSEDKPLIGNDLEMALRHYIGVLRDGESGVEWYKNWSSGNSDYERSVMIVTSGDALDDTISNLEVAC
jgi:hypothetical protein